MPSGLRWCRGQRCAGFLRGHSVWARLIPVLAVPPWDSAALAEELLSGELEVVRSSRKD